MKKVRFISLFLALVLCLGLLSACSDTPDGGKDGGERVNGSWDSVDFDGQKVRLCVSAHQTPECNFPAASLYTKGPDSAGSNEVAKEVIARNTRAAQDLNVDVEYSTRNLYYDDVIEDVRVIVQTAAKNSPDIYNNDCCSLAYSMINGLLWNVKNPGDDVRNYFDFEADGWYTDFIKGCTFDQSKYYMFAGDYFIDMIRMAWVIYVNNDILSQNIGKMPTWCTSVEEFYEYVLAGFWDIDLLADLSSRVFTDGAGGVSGTAEKTDDIVGFALVHNSDWVFSAASGVTVYYQDAADGYKPKVMESIDEYQKVSNKFMDLLEGQGVYWQQEVPSSTECFLQGNFLFAISRLGEMESTVLREFDYAKGLVPVPKWDSDVQDDYHTVIHDQVEIGAILMTAQAYSAASALMQYLNEESDQVVHAYYDKGLKYKYNDDKIARDVMDLVRETVDSPFGFQIGDLCQTLYDGAGTLKGMYIEDRNGTLGSTFASEKDAYKDCMKKMLDKFAQFD